MSTRLANVGTKIGPHLSDGPGVVSAGNFFGAWVEYLASSPGAVTAHGFVQTNGDYSYVNTFLEVEFGTGAAGAEVVKCRTVAYSGNSGNAHPRNHMMPVPVYLGPTGTRVCLRHRRYGTGHSLPTGLIYSLDLTTDHVVIANPENPLLRPTVTPDGGSITVPANTTPWAWSSWVTVLTGEPWEIAITGLSPTNHQGYDVEWEIGTGAVGSEVGITRVRAPSYGGNSGSPRMYPLAGAHPVVANTRIAVRQRSSNPTPQTQYVMLLYLRSSSLLGPVLPASTILPTARRDWAAYTFQATTATQIETGVGRLLVAFVSCQVANAVSVTDTAGNTYLDSGALIANGSNRLRLFYAYNSRGHASNVITATLAGGATSNSFAISVREFTGLWTNAPTVTTGTGSTAGVGPVATGTINIADGVPTLFVAGFEGGDGTGGITSPTGLTVENFSRSGSSYDRYFADGFEVASADQTCGFMYNGTTGAVIAAAFTPVP